MREGEKAMAEYQAVRQAIRDKTVRPVPVPGAKATSRSVPRTRSQH